MHVRTDLLQDVSQCVVRFDAADLPIVSTGSAVLAVTPRGDAVDIFFLSASAASSHTIGATGVLVAGGVAVLPKDTARDSWAAAHDISGDAAVTAQMLADIVV